MLRMLPDLTFPVRPGSIDPLMDNVVQLNICDAGLNDRLQRALTLNFHIFDLYVKSGFKIDYRGEEGQRQMVADAMAFVGGSTIATKHGDLAAAHLSIDYHDTQSRLAGASLPLLSSNVNDLIGASRKLADMPAQTEQRVALLLDYLSKRPR